MKKNTNSGSSFSYFEDKTKGIQKQNLEERKNKIENTRAKIAEKFTWAFFITIIITLFYIPISNYFLEDKLELDIILLSISAIISSPFGFVLGYYFANGSNN